MISDGDGELFRAFTNGWVPWSVLVGPDGKVVFSENEFDESGFSVAIQQMYERPAARQETTRRAVAGAGCTVVLGGGTGGLVAARELRQRLPSDHRIVLVDRAANHLYQPSLLWQMVGERRLSQFSRPLDRLQRKGIEFRHTEAESLDLDNRVVVTSDGNLDYDSLIVSLGAQLAPETVAGFDEMAFNLYTAEGCDRIHAALRDFTEGVVGILIPALPFKCPAAPYEAAFLTESYLRKKGIRRNVEIHLFTPEHTPMPVAPAALGDSIADMLAARGIHYHPLFTFQTLRPETREVVASDGEAHRVDLLMCVPPHQAPEVIRSSPLLGVSGFVHVDPRRCKPTTRTCTRSATSRRSSCPTARLCQKRASSPTPRRRRWRSGSQTPPTVRSPTPCSPGTATAGSNWVTAEPDSQAATSTPNPNPRSSCADPADLSTGARSPSRSGGYTTGSRQIRLRSAVSPRGPGCGTA